MKRLYPYQRRLLYNLRGKNRFAIFLKMRLGKTVLMVRRLLKDPRARRVLVVAPYSALNAWQTELDDCRETYNVLTGTRAQRLQRLQTLKRWNLINVDGFRVIPEIADVHWTTMILDESASYLRNPKAQVTKFFLRRFVGVPQKYILTGTPNPESHLDWYCQMAFVFGSFCGCSSYWQYRARYFTRKQYRFYLTRAGMLKVRDELERRSVRLTRKEVRDVKAEKIFERRVLTMETAQRRQYEKLLNDWVLDDKVVIWQTQRWIGLRQICSQVEPFHLKTTVKARELVGLLKGELKGERCVVYCVFLESVQAVASHLSTSGLHALQITGSVAPARRQDIVEHWARVPGAVLVCQVDCVSMGGDFSKANVVVYYEEPVSQLIREQSEDRVISMAKTDPCLFISLLMEDSIEEDIHQLKALKAMRAEVDLNETLRRAVAAAKERRGLI